MDNKTKLEDYIQKLRIRFDSNQNKVLNELNKCIKNIDNSDSNGIKSSDKIMTYRIIIIVIIALVGVFTSLGNILYFFGMVFFLSGHFIALKTKGVGLIFLFSHSCTGLAIMTGSLLSITPYNSQSSILDLYNGKLLTSNMSDYLVLSLLLIVCAIIYVIVYNLNDRLKEKPNNELIPLVLYMIAIIMIGIFPYITNIIG